MDLFEVKPNRVARDAELFRYLAVRVTPPRQPEYFSLAWREALLRVVDSVAIHQALSGVHGSQGKQQSPACPYPLPQKREGRTSRPSLVLDGGSAQRLSTGTYWRLLAPS